MSQTPTARSIALVGSVSLTVGFALLIGYRPSALPDSLTEPLTQGTEALGDRRIVLLTGGLLAAHWIGRIRVLERPRCRHRVRHHVGRNTDSRRVDHG